LIAVSVVGSVKGAMELIPDKMDLKIEDLMEHKDKDEPEQGNTTIDNISANKPSDHATQ